MKMRHVSLGFASLLLLGATESLQPAAKPGDGTLCLGGLLYIAKHQGDICFAGEDPNYQNRLDRYATLFDDYLIRNFPNGESDLKSFKERQITRKGPPEAICPKSRDSNIYELFKTGDAAELDKQVATLLERDGRPTFGDCL